MLPYGTDSQWWHHLIMKEAAQRIVTGKPAVSEEQTLTPHPAENLSDGSALLGLIFIATRAFRQSCVMLLKVFNS